MSVVPDAVRSLVERDRTHEHRVKLYETIGATRAILRALNQGKEVSALLAEEALGLSPQVLYLHPLEYEEYDEIFVDALHGIMQCDAARSTRFEA